MKLIYSRLNFGNEEDIDYCQLMGNKSAKIIVKWKVKILHGLKYTRNWGKYGQKRCLCRFLAGVGWDEEISGTAGIIDTYCQG